MGWLLLKTFTVSFSRTISRRLLEIGLILGVLGSFAVAWSSAYILRAMRSRNGAQRHERTQERVLILAGFGLIAFGLGFQFLGQLTRVFK